MEFKLVLFQETNTSKQGLVFLPDTTLKSSTVNIGAEMTSVEIKAKQLALEEQ